MLKLVDVGRMSDAINQSGNQSNILSIINKINERNACDRCECKAYHRAPLGSRHLATGPVPRRRPALLSTIVLTKVPVVLLCVVDRLVQPPTWLGNSSGTAVSTKRLHRLRPTPLRPVCSLSNGTAVPRGQLRGGQMPQYPGLGPDSWQYPGLGLDSWQYPGLGLDK